jgi:hypothetical protein
MTNSSLDPILFVFAILSQRGSWNAMQKERSLDPQKGVTAQCTRTDLNKRFLPEPMTTTGWKGTP